MANTKQEKQRKAQEAAKQLLPPLKTPSKFSTFFDAVQWAKSCVYLIARVRPTAAAGKFQVISMGTGFIAAKNRFVTCAHVINNTQSKEPITQHHAGDMYVFVRRDEDGKHHQTAAIPLTENQDLFTYPNLDLAIIHLPESFYTPDKQTYYHHPDHRIKISASSKGIGFGVGVLGYPNQQISFDGNGKLDMGNVMIRADHGTINMRYTDSVEKYEFTMAFNHGNSGGPIIDEKTGQAIAIVHGYRSQVVGYRSLVLNAAQKAEHGVDKVIAPVNSTYSIGISTKNFSSILQQHQIDFAS